MGEPVNGLRLGWRGRRRWTSRGGRGAGFLSGRAECVYETVAALHHGGRSQQATIDH